MNQFDLVPNRIFVGGLPFNANESDLKEYFCKLPDCNVNDVKIILDTKGISKGFGFVTFETEDEANKVLSYKSDSLSFKDQVLNIAQAYRRKYTNYGNYQQYGNKNANSGNSSGSNALNVQIENTSKSVNYLLSPTSGKVLNAMTPISSNTECLSTNSTTSDAKPESPPVSETINKHTDLDLTDTSSDKKLADNLSTKEDKNNNILDNKTFSQKICDQKMATSTIPSADDSKKNVSKRDTNNNHTGYNNKSNYQNLNANQRNYYSISNNHRTNQSYNGSSYPSRFQGGNSKGHNVHTPNNKHSQYSNNFNVAKNYNNQQVNKKFTNNSPIQYYYAMAAAALTTGNMRSPVNQQQNNLSMMTGHTKSSFNPQLNRSKHTAEAKPLNYVGSMMNIYPPNMLNHVMNAHNTEPLSQSSSYQVNNRETIPTNGLNYQTQVNAVKQSNANTQNNYVNQQKQQNKDGALNSEQSTGPTGIMYTQSSSESSYSSSSFSSASSNTPNPTNQIVSNGKLQQQTTNSQNCHMAANNNNAVNFVNHSASINSDATINAPPVHVMIAPGSVNNTSTVPINQQTQYPPYQNYYYYNTVNPANIRQPINSPPNSSGELSNTGNSSTGSSITPGPLTPQSQYSQAPPVYYTQTSLTASSSSVPIVQQPALTLAEPAQAYLQPISTGTNCTITNAFETVTNSSNSSGDQTGSSYLGQSASVEHLDDLMRKNLVINPECNSQNAQQNPQYYYLPHSGYPQVPVYNNGIVPQINGPPTYYYYYAPIPAEGLADAPQNYQIQPTLFQPPPLNNNQTIPFPTNQPSQMIPVPANSNFHSNPLPNTHPIQINTINSNQMPPVQNQPINGPLSAPQTGYYTTPNYGHPTYQSSTVLSSPPTQLASGTSGGGVPLLQLPPMYYGGQHNSQQILQNNSTLVTSQNNSQKRGKVMNQSPSNRSISQSTNPSQSQNKTQYYLNTMNQNQLKDNYSNNGCNFMKQTYNKFENRSNNVQFYSTGQNRNYNQNKGAPNKYNYQNNKGYNRSNCYYQNQNKSNLNHTQPDQTNSLSTSANNLCEKNSDDLKINDSVINQA